MCCYGSYVTMAIIVFENVTIQFALLKTTYIPVFNLKNVPLLCVTMRCYGYYVTKATNVFENVTIQFGNLENPYIEIFSSKSMLLLW